LPNWIKVAPRSLIAPQDSGTVLPRTRTLSGARTLRSLTITTATIGACVCLLACGKDTVWTQARIKVARPMATACQLDADAPLTIHALGDFPPSGNTVERLDPVNGTLSIERFPLDTRQLRFELGTPDPTGGGSLSLRPDTETQSVLLLPLGRSCPSPDFEARARQSSAVVALPDGSLLIAGGRDDDMGPVLEGAAVSTAFVLQSGYELAEQVTGGMFLRRSGATATVLGDEVLLIGGGAHDRGPAHDTFETFSLDTQRFSANAGATLSHGPRRDHAAIALRDGSSVLVVGGVSELGTPPLSSVEIVTTSSSRALDVTTLARRLPSLHRMSDGRVVIVGGRDDNDDVVTAIEVFDPANESVTALSAEFPASEQAASTSVVGDRVAWVGCDALLCRVALLLGHTEPPRVVQDVALLPALQDPRVTATSEGALLVVGRRSGAGLAEAFRVDVSNGDTREVNASRPATELHVLEDGTIAELDTTGLSLRRDSLSTPFDNPAATLVAGDSALALDTHQHWTRSSGDLVAQVDDARVDIAGLVWGNFSLTLDVPTLDDTNLELLVTGKGNSESVVITAADISLGTCHIAREPDVEAVTIERREDSLTLHAGSNHSTCTADLGEHITLAFIANTGTPLRPLRLRRL